MQNPVRQNFKHLKAVMQLLDFLPYDAFTPVVIFTGEAEFKTGRPKGVSSPEELLHHMKSTPPAVMSVNRMAFSVGRLTCARYSLTEKTDIEHQLYLDRKFGSLG
ncbi:hypothetical protein GCM10025772_24840 [Ferrimonas gelatinilytica]|uniref:Transposase, YhgA-like n=2 Tax=Ferrimonas gelatinilytica TaxID=1255257 RepID=A0ABP9SDU9_9GAMM